MVATDCCTITLLPVVMWENVEPVTVRVPVLSIIGELLVSNVLWVTLRLPAVAMAAGPSAAAPLPTSTWSRVRVPFFSTAIID